MTTYFDSSALVAVYVPERFSPAARRALSASPQAPFTPLHELEVSNAFALLLGRRLISTEEHRKVQTQLGDDLESGRLIRLAVDWEAVFTQACDLSGAHTRHLLTRSLDVLHVAAALASACARFVSADTRQLALAKATGLEVVDITRGAPRAKR